MRKFEPGLRRIIYIFVFCVLLLGDMSWGVTSKITRHRSAKDLLKGETEKTVISSEGKISLGRLTTELDCGDLFEDVWTINVVVRGGDGAIYLGTSPNGHIIKYKDGEATRIYPVEAECEEEKAQAAKPDEPADPNSSDESQSDKPTDPNSSAEEVIANEHIFAMAIDAGGRLLAAVSGKQSQLLRFDNGEIETIFTPDDTMYILAMVLDDAGFIYLGTGPKGKIYRLDPFGQNAKVVGELKDKNVLSLAIGQDGFIYAGCDQRGIVYKINPSQKKVSALFDSEQLEITALLFDDEGNLYAAATSAQAVKSQSQLSAIAADASSGRPDTKPKKNDGDKKSSDSGSMTLQIANTGTSGGAGSESVAAGPKRGALPKSAGHIYKIDEHGFVTDVFSEMAVFFTMIQQDSQLLLGTGNKAQLFTIDLENEQKTIAYEDDEAAQITALILAGEDVYVGTSNPPKLLKLSKSLESRGSYISALVDAGQPAQWGKLQIDAEIPSGSKVLLAARSGNIKDPNDPTFSPWTKDIVITAATQLMCPIGRFCQYRLTLQTGDDGCGPVIREIATAHVVPNLAPRVTAVSATRSKDKKKPYVFQVTFKSEDDNKDKLVYEIEFRKLGRSGWIKLKDKLTASKYDWDTRTIEDGRYEVRVIANDRQSNTTATELAGTRISDAFVVDNTAPEIQNENITVGDKAATIALALKDEYTAIGKVSYTVDSNEDWIGTLPDDMIYDTTDEDLTIVIEELEPGEHVVAVKIADDIGNTMYKTFEVNID
jgi:hypothetical protein